MKKKSAPKMPKKFSRDMMNKQSKKPVKKAELLKAAKNYKKKK